MTWKEYFAKPDIIERLQKLPQVQKDFARWMQKDIEDIVTATKQKIDKHSKEADRLIEEIHNRINKNYDLIEDAELDILFDSLEVKSTENMHNLCQWANDVRQASWTLDLLLDGNVTAFVNEDGDIQFKASPEIEELRKKDNQPLQDGQIFIV